MVNSYFERCNNSIKFIMFYPDGIVEDEGIEDNIIDEDFGTLSRMIEMELLAICEVLTRILKKGYDSIYFHGISDALVVMLKYKPKELKKFALFDLVSQMKNIKWD